MTHLDLGRTAARHDDDIAAVYDMASRLERRPERPPRVRQSDARVRRTDGIETQLAVVIDLVSRDRR